MINTFKRLMSHDINRNSLMFLIGFALAWLIADPLAKFAIAAKFDGGLNNHDALGVRVLVYLALIFLFTIAAGMSFLNGYEAATFLYRKHVRSQWLKSVADLTQEEAKRVAEEIEMCSCRFPRQYWNKYSLASLASLYGTVLHSASFYFHQGSEQGGIVDLLHDLREHYSQREVERFVRLAGKRHTEVKKILNQAMNTCLAQEPNRKAKARNRSLERKAKGFM